MVPEMKPSEKMIPEMRSNDKIPEVKRSDKMIPEVRMKQLIFETIDVDNDKTKYKAHK